MSFQVLIGKVAFLCVLFYVFIGFCGASLYAPGLQCEFYTPEDCAPSSSDSDPSVIDERCEDGTTCDPAPNHSTYCMAQWKNESGTIQWLKKGCWGEDDLCEGKTGCFEDFYDPFEYFCCCQGNRCNSEVFYRPTKEFTVTDRLKQQTPICEYYDPYECEKGNLDACNLTVQECEFYSDSTKPSCYALLNNASGEHVVMKKGCWLGEDECTRNSCVNSGSTSSKDPPADTFFCCCSGSMCNVDVYFRIVPPTPSVDQEPDGSRFGGRQLLMTITYTLVPIVAFTLLILISFWMWKRHKTPPYHEALANVETTPVSPPSPILPLRPIQLIEIKARGRFGCVWKAQMGPEVVAVKIFPLQDRQSYMVEKEIYQLPYFQCQENVLRFIGGEKRGDTNSLNTEMWLITEYHSIGSLFDFLKGNLLTWTSALIMSDSMTKGLAFLHDEIPSPKLSCYKPPVVHRDFKSKNVLIKNDMTACIADLGLALKFDPGKPIGDTHGQVGTRRYMAPEVLEGSINFSRDHFMRIDMYAYGLVLWEIVSRCSAVDGPVEEYQLPFEDEVGLHPRLEEMQDVVVQKKLRPPIKQNWLCHAGMNTLAQSIQDCWDTDPEARLSAGCILERISELARSNQHTSSPVPQILTTTNTQLAVKESSLASIV